MYVHVCGSFRELLLDHFSEKNIFCTHIDHGEALSQFNDPPKKGKVSSCHFPLNMSIYISIYPYFFIIRVLFIISFIFFYYFSFTIVPLITICSQHQVSTCAVKRNKSTEIDRHEIISHENVYLSLNKANQIIDS